MPPEPPIDAGPGTPGDVDPISPISKQTMALNINQPPVELGPAIPGSPKREEKREC